MVRVVVLGAGGHAQVVADILLQMSLAGESVLPIGYLDDNPRLVGSSFLGLPVLGQLSELSAIDHDVVIALGDDHALPNRFHGRDSFVFLSKNGLYRLSGKRYKL